NSVHDHRRRRRAVCLRGATRGESAPTRGLQSVYRRVQRKSLPLLLLPARIIGQIRSVRRGSSCPPSLFRQPLPDQSVRQNRASAVLRPIQLIRNQPSATKSTCSANPPITLRPSFHRLHLIFPNRVKLVAVPHSTASRVQPFVTANP